MQVFIKIIVKQLVKNNFLKIKLRGEEKNQWGIGSKVTLYSNGNKYYQEEMPVRGFQSSVDPVLNFGIGKKSSVDSVVVIWPNDKMQTLKNVKANQTISVNIKDAYRQPGFMIQQPLHPIILYNNQHLILLIPKINLMILRYNLC